ncbi:biotin/lipoyl-containing protein [Nguyenibacter sp. L1]|uniref:biotin/lipoyl-containing protein n=1 Tax=Nguyenibacter sp. L1 TaxID=3049350 RepID=UPI002B49AF21|nr:biotin/lipoyl-containing protein [Nguyenibacter sp. L1]WRH89773.1 biotin/lipoyl-containing protein [Nguyenibacter sp. L1]
MSEKFLEELEEIIVLLRASGTKKFDYSSSTTTVHLTFADVAETPPSPTALASAEEMTQVSSPGIGYVHFVQPGTEHPLIELGAAVTRDQTIAIVAFDSIFMSVKSPVSGKIADLHVVEGQRVGYDDLIATVTP